MSTTMVGNHLKALEQRLGVRLLNRTTRRQRLTEFGTAYYQRCLEVLGLVADSERLAEQAVDEPSGTLRITAPLTFGTERLAPALSEFCPALPAGKTRRGADQPSPGPAGTWSGRGLSPGRAWSRPT